MSAILSVDASLNSLRESFDRYSQVANRVANTGAGDDLARDFVELMQVRAQVKANVVSIKDADETLGTLLDTFA